jgi:hypothetical protein
MHEALVPIPRNSPQLPKKSIRLLLMKVSVRDNWYFHNYIDQYLLNFKIYKSLMPSIPLVESTVEKYLQICAKNFFVRMFTVLFIVEKYGMP